MGRRERRHSPLLVRRRNGAQPPEASFPDDRAVDLAVVFASDGACLLTTAAWAQALAEATLYPLPNLQDYTLRELRVTEVGKRRSGLRSR